MYKQNLHIHSVYCDGKDKPEDMILCAIEKGFDSIGFSGHSYMSFNTVLSMSLDGTADYNREIELLKEKYKEKIKVFRGIEFEMYSGVDSNGYDYVIGSVHYLKINDEYVGFDRSADEVERVINTYFDGDGMKYAKAFYETVSLLPTYGDFQIAGHFDLITKHSENRNFFDTNSKKYQNYALDALHTLAEKIKVFEVNTGAVARGYRKAPYPAPFILRELKNLGCGVVITSDCHDKNYIDCGYNEACELIKACGFDEIMILTDKGFTGEKI